VLSDDSKRKLYDRCGEECVKKEGMMDGGKITANLWNFANKLLQAIRSLHSSVTSGSTLEATREGMKFIREPTLSLTFMRLWRRCTPETLLR
jgi:DnaJ-class molecular chaperone